MKTINLYFDFEFTSLSPDAQPISLGIVSDEIITEYGCPKCGKDGFVFPENDYNMKCLNCGENIARMVYQKGIKSEFKSFYAEFSDFDINRCDDWVKENVVSKLLWNDQDMCDFPDNDHQTNSKGIFELMGKALKEWLSQFSDYQIQFICDCGTYDWYWLVQLLAEWNEVKENDICNGDRIYDITQEKGISISCMGDYELSIKSRTGLPKLPDNISPVPSDLNDLIAFKEKIPPADAFDIERLGTYCYDNKELSNNVPQTHNALFDAKVIKETYQKLFT